MMDSNRQQFFQCFQPIFLPLFATGCLSFRLNSEQKLEVSALTKFYTNFARLALLGCFITGWIMKVYSHKYSQHVRELSPLIQFLGFAELLISIITYIEVSVILDIKKHAHIELYERAYQLDKSLSKEFGVNFNYPKTIRKNTIYMTSFSLYCGIYYVMYIVNMDPDWKVAMMALGYATCTLGPGASSYGHITSMDYLRVRFRLFQKLFKKYFLLRSKEEEMKRRKILSLLSHYQKYCELIQEVNNIYGHVAIANIFHDFSQASSMVFVLCHKASESRTAVREYIFLFMFVLPRLIKIVYTAVYSRLTLSECKASSQIIATYDDHYPVKEIKDNIHAFLLWKQHNCFKFTIGKGLVSNFGLLYSFFLGIGNYVLILIQLKLQESSIEDRLNDKLHAENISKIKFK